RKRIEALQARGGQLVVIDPRRSETARLADRHLFIRPGADGLLLAALVQTVLQEKLTRDRGAAWRAVNGDALAQALAPFAPGRVEDRLGIPAAELRELARAFAAAPSAICYGRVGTSQHPFGTLCSWLADVLNLLTGNLDHPGGVMFTTPAVDFPGLVAARSGGGRLTTGRTRVRGAPCFNGEAPTACLAEEIMTAGPGQVRGLVTIAGNPVLSAPNGAALGRALASLDHYVAIDFYLNETTRHADLILPPSGSLEHDNYEALFHLFAVRNSAKYSPAAVRPDPSQREDFEILVDLGLRIGRRKARGLRRLGWRVLRALPRPSIRRLLGWMLRAGPYGDGFRPWRTGLRLKDLEARPSGIDLGPLVPRLGDVILSEGGRIELAPEAILAELARLERALTAAPEAGDDRLSLIGRRDVRTCNSWLHNTRVGTQGRERCTLQMHPDDAAGRGLEAGSQVRIRSRVGEVEAPLELSTDLMPGIVSLPHGWGHRGPGLRMALAEAHPGVSCNDLVDDQVLEAVVGNAVFNGVPVTVEPA
ncbi:MAG: molybdopterin dinucleotide binding domain-containing protein, partial [Myxococcota bacterium]